MAWVKSELDTFLRRNVFPQIQSSFANTKPLLYLLVGSDEDFVFSDCYFGSLWGLYHVDIEPNSGRHVRDGLFVRCTFDGTRAGEMNTDTWGAMLTFCGSHDAELPTRNVTVMDCDFKDISIRIRGIFPGAQFLYNQMSGRGARAFVKVRTNKVGEFRDAVIRGNRFTRDGKPFAQAMYGATFTGESVFEGNYPDQVNQIKPTAPGTDTHWEEDHPAAQPKEKTGGVTPASLEQMPQARADSPATARQVTMPLMAHRFRFEDGAILPYRADEFADVVFHVDPLIAEGTARLQKLGAGTLADFSVSAIPSEQYDRVLWGVQRGDVLAVRTREGRLALMRIERFSRSDITFSYYISTAAPTASVPSTHPRASLGD